MNKNLFNEIDIEQVLFLLQIISGYLSGEI